MKKTFKNKKQHKILDLFASSIMMESSLCSVFFYSNRPIHSHVGIGVVIHNSVPAYTYIYYTYWVHPIWCLYRDFFHEHHAVRLSSEELMDNTAQRARVIMGHFRGLPDIWVFMGTSCFQPPVIQRIPSLPKSLGNARNTVQNIYTEDYWGIYI